MQDFSQFTICISGRLHIHLLLKNIFWKSLFPERFHTAGIRNARTHDGCSASCEVTCTQMELRFSHEPWPSLCFVREDSWPWGLFTVLSSAHIHKQEKTMWLIPQDFFSLLFFCKWGWPKGPAQTSWSLSLCQIVSLLLSQEFARGLPAKQASRVSPNLSKLTRPAVHSSFFFDCR